MFVIFTELSIDFPSAYITLCTQADSAMNDSGVSNINEASWFMKIGELITRFINQKRQKGSLCCPKWHNWGQILAMASAYVGLYTCTMDVLYGTPSENPNEQSKMGVSWPSG